MSRFLKRLFFTLAATVGILAGFVYFLSGRVTVSADGNVVTNPGFEDRKDDLPKSWTLEKKASNKGKAALATPAHSGSLSLKLFPNAANISNNLLDNPLGIGQGFPARPFRGRKVYVSAWLAAEGGAEADVGLFGLTKAGGLISVELKQHSDQSGWKFHDDVLVLPDDNRIAYLIVTCIAHGTSGSASFDDIYVSTSVPGTFGAPPPVSSESKNRPVSTAIRVDASRIVRRIPREIYGSNLEWIWDGNGVFDEKTGAPDPQILQLTREAAPSILRFPGGVFSDFYHWRDGVGPQAVRKEISPTPGAGKMKPVFGTDEALQFAEAAGSELMITVNAGTGTAAEAADWVRYVNGSKRRVRFWEIGNELYVNDGSAQAQKSTMPPDRYAQLVREFAKAMRAADPGIQIGAIGEENYSSTAVHGYRDWTGQVLAIAGGSIDFLSVHNAYAPALAMDKGWPLRTVYSAMLAAPVLMRTSLEGVSKKIGESAAGNRKAFVAVTEWGPYFQITPDGRFVDHLKTLGSGLFVADMLKVFAESPDVGLANGFKLVDPLFMGWIGKQGSSYVPGGPLLALEMFTRHFGTDLVKTSVEAPTYDSPAVGWVDAVNGVPLVDAVSSRAGGKLFLIAINKDFDRPIEAQLNIEGFRGSCRASWVLNGPGIDANNGSEPFRAPGVKWAPQAVDGAGGFFVKGAPNTLRIEEAPCPDVRSGSKVVLPAHSVVSLEFDGR